MRYEDDAFENGRAAQGAQRFATKSVDILKAATSLGKGRAPEAANDEITPAPAPAPAVVSVQQAPVADRAPSTMGVNLEMTGSLTTPNDLQVYGKITGDVRAATLTICAGGQIIGEVVAEVVIVQGTVEGRILGQKVQLHAGASVRGDIIHAALSVDGAALFEGSSKRSANPLDEVGKRKA